MTLGLLDIRDAALSHAQASGWFDRVLGHEPKNPPGDGLTLAVWVAAFAPLPARSGLNTTSARVELSARVYMPMLHEPQDEIDPTLLSAVDQLVADYSGDFTLGGLVSYVDLLGAHGEPLGGRMGYLEHSGQVFRVFGLTVPLVINNLWSQAA